MPTPTQSLVNRGSAETDAQLRQVIFENEKLKIQVQALKEQLDGSGLQHVRALKEENAALKSQLGNTKIQLEEKTAQLDLLRNSDARFSTIGDSLQDLMTQLREQREKLEAMQALANDKDVQIEKLEGQLQAHQQDASAGRTQADAVEAMRRDFEEKEASLQNQLHESTEAYEDLQRALQAAKNHSDTLELERDAARAEAERAVAAAASAARAPPPQADVVAAPCTECDALRRQCDTLTAQLASKHAEVERLNEQMKDVIAQSAAAAAAAATDVSSTAALPTPMATPAFDPTTKEAKAFVEKKIQEAVQDRERRLHTLIDQNASLLSRLSLLQDTQGMAAKKATQGAPQQQQQQQRPPQPPQSPAQPQQQQQQQRPQANPFEALRQAAGTSAIDYQSRRKDARSAVERRFEAVLRNDIISKEDVQLLLQEVLDYQENIDLDTQTQLYIKDLQRDDALQEMKLQLERLENEKRTLTKQLQRDAFQELQRTRQGSLDGAGDASAGTTPVRGAGPAALQMDNPWGPARPRETAATNTAARASLTGLHDSPAFTLAAGQHHLDPNVSGGGAAAQRPPPQPTQYATGGGAPHMPESFMVSCPACTYEQSYGSGKCQLCETTLPPPAAR